MRNIDEAARALTEKPMLAADAERILIAHDLMDLDADLPQPVRFARALTAILDRVSVPLEEYDLIAGRSVQRLLSDEEEEKFREICRDNRSPYKSCIFSSGHCSYDWEMVVKYGITGLIRKARTSLDAKQDEGRKTFLRSIIEVYEAITRYILRYSDAAEKRGMTELSSTLRKAALKAAK